MAKFKGTNGNDTITGSAGDDTIVPLLGQDTVDGGTGYDTLTIDYSSLADAYWFSSMALAADGSWSGAVTGGASSAQNYVSFANVEQIKFTATQADDYLTVDLGTRAPDKARLNLDGWGGDDTLSVLGGELTKRLTLTVDASGKAKANFATLAGWDNYDIGLGVSAGNSLVLGDGDDMVSSTGGQDTIDGGGGYDQWTGYYQSISAGVDFFFTTATATATVTSGGAQLAEVKNAEYLSIQTGGGDDSVVAYGGAGVFNGGGGSDELTLNPFGAGAAMRYEVYMANATILAGTATPLSGGDALTFYNYEDIVFGGSVDADQFVFDASQYALANLGFDIHLAGGGGQDSLTLDLRAQGVAAVRRDGADAGHVDGLGAANALAWTGIEALTATLGAGDDTVDFSVASQALTLDGGAGLDTIDFSAATAGVYLNLGFAAPTTVDGISVSVTNVEGVIGSEYADYILDSAAADWIRLGNGNDTVRAGAASPTGTDVFDGGAGQDTISYSSAASAVYVSLGVTTAQNTGGGGTDILTGFETLVGSAYSDILTGSTLSDVLSGADGDDRLEGGAGNDTLYGGAGVDTASYAGATGAVVISLAVVNQNTGGAGTDGLYDIENVIGSIYNDTLGGNAGANRLSGGRGADTLTGGGGADVFGYASTLDSTGSGYDTVTDFSHAQGDKIDLQAVDAIASTPRFNDAFTWIGDAAFHGVAGELREVAARGGGWFIYGDTNGDKVADMTIFVNSSTPPLPNSDILL